MSDRSTTRLQPSPVGDRPSVSGLLDRQRLEWHAGRRTPVEDLLRHAAADDELVLDLLYNEVILRQELGETPALEEYSDRFPRLAEPLRLLFEVDGGLAAGFSKPPGDTVDEKNRPTGSTPSPGLADVPGYQLLATLGRGGMGVVYKARQIALDRIVALKVIRAGVHADEGELRRFHTEALAAARLQHPNIAQVFEVAEHEGRPFLVLEYVAGGGLDRRLAGAPIPPAAAARMTELLARAVHSAHERGVVHRDLKPANVLLQHDATAVPDGVGAGPWFVLDGNAFHPKLTDFGLAKLLDGDAARTETGHILGTPMYMAPEQAAGRPDDIGPRSDVYSLGAILYECLTGQPPFQGATALDTLAQVRSQEPEPPRRLRPRIPRDLETICLKCLEKEPRRRYPSALALAEDLQRFSAGRPVHARPIGRVARAVRWVRRHPAGAAASALAVVLVSAGLVAGWLALDHKWRLDRTAMTALLEAASLRDAHKWAAAQEALRRAQEPLRQSFAPSAAIGREIEHQRADLRLVEALEQVLFEIGDIAPERHELSRLHGPDDYRQAFAAAGYLVGETDPEVVGLSIRGKPPAVRAVVVAAIDDWITILGSSDEAGRRQWLERAVATADPDDPWRKQLRLARSRNDMTALRSLAAGADAPSQPATAVLTLAALLTARGAPAEAVDLLRRAQQQSPGEFWISTRLASYCAALQPPALDDAWRYALVAQALRPGEPGPHFFVGYVARKLGQTDDAIAAFRRATELDGRYVVGLVYLAEAFKFEKNWASADRVLKIARTAKPDHAPVHDLLAEALAKLQRWDEAIAAHREAVRLDPDRASYHENLGVTLHAADRRDEAIPVLRTAVRLNPTSYAGNHNLGYLLTITGHPEEGIPFLRAAIALRPDLAVAHLNLGRALARLERHEEAIPCYREAIQLQPSMAEAHVSLGTALEKLKDRPGAYAAFRAALEVDDNNPNALCFLGRMLMTDGQPAEALVHLRKGHAIGSKHPKWNRPSAEWIKEAEAMLERK